MVFEESTFVLTKAPAKAAAEVTEPVVSDPSKKLDIPQQPAPSVTVESPLSGKQRKLMPKPCTTGPKLRIWRI